MFPPIYANQASSDTPHLGPRSEAIEPPQQHHLHAPRKYTLKFILKTWDRSNARWVGERGGKSNHLFLLRKAGRPAFGSLNVPGLPMGVSGAGTFRPPETFDLDDADGFFQKPTMRPLESDFDRIRRGRYRRTPSIPSGRNSGAIAPLGRSWPPESGEFSL